jgi:hypothetical protein
MVTRCHGNVLWLHSSGFQASFTDFQPPATAKPQEMDPDILRVKYVNKCEPLKNVTRFGPSLTVKGL